VYYLTLVLCCTKEIKAASELDLGLVTQCVAGIKKGPSYCGNCFEGPVSFFVILDQYEVKLVSIKVLCGKKR
jgi:hypothetical protein